MFAPKDIHEAKNARIRHKAATALKNTLRAQTHTSSERQWYVHGNMACNVLQC